jgi:hypothetical protein
MTPQEIADSILARLNLPEDLRGRFVNVVGFPDEKNCRAFYPERSHVDHERAYVILQKEVRRRGGDTCRTIIAVTLAVESESQDGRARIANAYTYLVPVPGSRSVARTGT